MRRLLRRVAVDIRRGDNIDLLVTVALVLAISVLDGLGVAPIELVSSITLATLGLIAVGLLITRYRIEEIACEANTHNLICFSAEKPASLKHNLENTGEVWMLGVTLWQTTQNNFHLFSEKVSNGGKIRVLVSNPDKINLGEIIARFARPGTAVSNILSNSDGVLRMYTKIKECVRNDGSVQVRLLGFVPPYSLYIFPQTENGGVVYVEVYGHRSESGKSGSIPKFQVTERENLEWYRHFITQFETMWAHSQEYE